MTPMEIAAPGVALFAALIAVPSAFAWWGLRREKKESNR